jgi:uncharacterized membrane protein
MQSGPEETDSSIPPNTESQSIEPIPPQVLEAFPEKAERNIALRAISIFSQVTHSTYSGPLPPPQIFKEYNDILPGAADRILRMAEIQAAHRQSLERHSVWSGSNRAYLGLFFGFIISVIITVGAIHLLNTGRDVTGFGLLLTAAVGFVGLYLKVVQNVENERRERYKELLDHQKPVLPSPSAQNNSSTKTNNKPSSKTNNKRRTSRRRKR